MVTARQYAPRSQIFEIPVDDADQIEGPLTVKQEAFAMAWAETGNQAAAYRMAYQVGDRTTPNTIWAAASRIAAIPKIRARHRELHEKALLETIYSVRELFQHQVNIATADPNDIVRTVVRCCRHCHGVDHKHQWIDEDEFLMATAEALDKGKKQLPGDAGGFGFNSGLEPVAGCTHCHGEGQAHVVIADTTKLTGKARALYAGAKQDRHGVIEIKLHDQARAAEFVGRMMGVLKDGGLDLRTDAQRQADKDKSKMPENCTAQDASKAYLSLLDP